MSAQDPCAIAPSLPLCAPPETEPPPDDGTPTPQPTDDPTPTGQEQPTPQPTPSNAPTDAGSVVPSPEAAEPPTVGDGVGPAPGEVGGQPAPQVAEPVDGAGEVGGAPVVLVGVDGLAAALPGAFGIGLLTVLLGVGTVVGTRGLLRRGGLLARSEDGGIDVERTHRTRTLLGVALLAAAAVAGVIGYLKISLEPIVAVQVVYLASAGFAVVVLAVAGGSLIVSDQLRADERRVAELESAVTVLAEQLRASVQEPPRLLDRGPHEAAAPPTPKTRRSSRSRT